MAYLPPGVSGGVSAPCTYTMTYFNGQITYTERFVLLTCSKEYVGPEVSALDAVVKNLANQLAGIVIGVVPVGAALDAMVQWGWQWFKNLILNPDGSLTLLFAYHYCGTHAGGIDLTAQPLPGVNPQSWDSLVNGLMQLVSSQISPMAAMNPITIENIAGHTPEGNSPTTREDA